MLTLVCTIFHSPEVTSKSSVNSAKQACHLFSPQSSLVIVYANGMYGMLASAHNDSQMLLRNIRESKSILCFKKVNYQCFYTFSMATKTTLWTRGDRNFSFNNLCPKVQANKCVRPFFICVYSELHHDYFFQIQLRIWSRSSEGSV